MEYIRPTSQTIDHVAGYEASPSLELENKILELFEIDQINEEEAAALLLTLELRSSSKPYLENQRKAMAQGMSSLYGKLNKKLEKEPKSRKRNHADFLDSELQEGINVIAALRTFLSLKETEHELPLGVYLGYQTKYSKDSEITKDELKVCAYTNVLHMLNTVYQDGSEQNIE